MFLEENKFIFNFSDSSLSLYFGIFNRVVS